MADDIEDNDEWEDDADNGLELLNVLKSYETEYPKRNMTDKVRTIMNDCINKMRADLYEVNHKKKRAADGSRLHPRLSILCQRPAISPLVEVIILRTVKGKKAHVGVVHTLYSFRTRIVFAICG
jgi:hypothetical protein